MLIVAGVGFGLFRGLRALSVGTADSPDLASVKARISALDLAVARLADQTEQVQSRLAYYVTREELAETVDRVFGKLESEVEARFERQTRSVEALRLMVGQTDELLQKVLDALESIRNDRDPVETRLVESQFVETQR